LGSLRINCLKIHEEILSFIKTTIKKSNAKGVVLGVSGGVDSSLASILCTQALGKKKVFGILLPDFDVTPKKDIEDAQSLVNTLGMKNITIPINQVMGTFLDTIPASLEKRMAIANLKTRVRMAMIYFFANSMNYLVAGTSDKSEILLGYFTKYGDGAADFLPIAHLYKTQVRQLAKYLKLPKDMANKPSSPQLWKGHKCTDEIPGDYSVLDPLLYALFDLKMNSDQIIEKMSVSPNLIQDLRCRYKNSEHKREKIPVIKNV
jgi:NAD+ synthase